MMLPDYGRRAIARGRRSRLAASSPELRAADNIRGLGAFRCVVEHTLSWLRQFRRLHVPYERRANIHAAFPFCASALISWTLGIT